MLLKAGTLLFSVFIAYCVDAAIPAASPPTSPAGRRIAGSSQTKSIRISLTQADFEQGTYRIKQPGYYVLTEDIRFGPQKDNDYWPPTSLWSEYPPAAYYLGFFAAITVEADDVTIDLGGFQIGQTDEFALLQRFFNVIELNDRIFVPNDGVSPLNYQETDKPVGTAVAVGKFISPRNIKIQNGHIGRLSHNGIHGNNITGLIIDGVIVEDFEVAGIQCNGCKDVVLRHGTVGPSAQKVPVLGTFSNARFLDFFANRLIPFGFEQEPNSKALLDIFQEKISFADRPGMEYLLQEVFDRLARALTLYKDHQAYITGSTTAATSQLNLDLSPDDATLLEEAKSVFDNPSGLPDGNALYGIFFNRLGMPKQDENFNGAGSETSNIVIFDMQIHGLYASPLEVPSLMTEEGAHMQGPARDIIRITDITTDRLLTLNDSKYNGNFLSDAYFALWKMSNIFYKFRVFDSSCGNFGSNASMPYNLFGSPSDAHPTCADLGMVVDNTLTGRDVTMLQKRYFGGLQISRGLYDWATSPGGSGLDTLMGSSPSQDVLRSGGRHKLVCDHDTMFHPMHGIAALKVVEALDVDIKHIDIYDIHNYGDFKIWACTNKWQLQPSGENIQAVTEDIQTGQGSNVRALQIIRSNLVSLSQLSITNLRSDEGAIIGISLIGDDNDRTDHSDDIGVSFDHVSIDRLSAPRSTVPFESVGVPFSSNQGIRVGPPEEADAALDITRTVLTYQVTSTRVPCFPDGSGSLIATVIVFMTPALLDVLKLVSTYDTDEKILGFRRKTLAYLEQHYGIRFPLDANSIDIVDPIPVLDANGELTDSVVLFGKYTGEIGYHGESICQSNGNGSINSCTAAGIFPIHDYFFLFNTGPSGYTFHGVFGDDAGKFSPPGNIILTGLYVFEGMGPDGKNLEVEYFGMCPIRYGQLVQTGVASYLNCALESEEYGKGLATGAFYFSPTENPNECFLKSTSTMIFDDIVTSPKESTKSTNLLDEFIPLIDPVDTKYIVVADGTFPTLLSNIEAVPFGSMYHYTLEAVVPFFKRRTSLQNDSAIKNLRTRFLERLRDEFGINLQPSDYNDIPVDGIIDLGGGNMITGYVVNEDANQRVMVKQAGSFVEAMPRASRLHEGGFRLFVGRAGIATIEGRLPFGTMFLEGMYFLEDPSAPNGEGYEISFHSLQPILLNEWSTSVIYNRVMNEELGEGYLLMADTLPEITTSGILVNLRGHMVFDTDVKF